MTIEQAKVYAKLSRKDLEIISCGYGKHYDAICAYAKGATIECRIDDDDEWEEAIPSFAAQFEYRVKPSEDKPDKPWSPKIGEHIFFISPIGEIIETPFRYFNEPLFTYGNCFRTRFAAESARNRVLAALRNRSPL